MQKSGTMTEKKRVMAVLRHEKPDRVPAWVFFDITGFSAVYHKRPIIDAYSDLSLSLELQRQTCQELGWACSPFFAAINAADFGGEMKMPESEFSQAPTVSRFPIETEEDALNFKIPALEKMPGVEREKRFHEMARGASPNFEPFSICLYAVSPFEVAGRLCRLENLARWMVRRPEIVHHLLRLTTDFLLGLTAYWKETFGTEGVLARGGGVSSSNQIISPKQFEHFVLPYLKKSSEKILSMGVKHILYHICGEQNPNLPHWKKVPMGEPGLVSVGSQVDLDTAIDYFGDRCIIIGNIEPTLIQNGTPAQVYEACCQCIEKGKRAPYGYMLMSGCELPPSSPPYNVYMMQKSVEDFGWY